jgi:predicted HTH domain antitoxin
MKTLTLYLPDAFDLDDKSLILLLAVKLYEQGKLSLGQAAEMAGISKRLFAEGLGKYSVSIFNFSSEELSMDVKNA